MPLPMIHLAIAARLGADHQACLSPAFLLGSLSPDAIHMRPETTRADKDVTHLIMEGRRFSEEADILALIQRHATAKPPLPVFAMGYAAHILTDKFWSQTVMDPFFAAIPDTLDDAGIRTLYYQETDQIDFDLYHHAAWRPEVWRELAAAEAADFSPLLTGDEIDKWRDRTLRWFTEFDEEPGIEPVYITAALARNFVLSASAHVEQQFATWGLLENLE